jgi:hypothetical protein
MTASKKRRNPATNGDGREFFIIKRSEENHWIVGDGMDIYQKYQNESKYKRNSASCLVERGQQRIGTLHSGKQTWWNLVMLSILLGNTSPDLDQRPSSTKDGV